MTSPGIAVPAQAVPVDRLSVLLVEDDPGDAFLVQELLDESHASFDVHWRPDLDAAHDVLQTVDCVLLDLGLPGLATGRAGTATVGGLDALHQVLALAPGQAVLVLTGLADEHRGAEAVLAGAQDYIVKGSLDGGQLARSVRYAVERRRAQEQARLLIRADARAAENVRLERGLLPTPLLAGFPVDVVTRYVPAGGQALLGGDFYDVVQTPDGRLHVVVGDVSGHGPDAAAIGVCLRVGWRALVLAGVPDADVLATLERLLVSERRNDETFVTLVHLVLEPDGRRLELRTAGHPAPLVLSARPRRLSGDAQSPPLGVLPGTLPAPETIALGPGESLLLYTDGMIEGRAAGGGGRLGIDGLLGVLINLTLAGVPAEEIVDRALAEVQQHHGATLEDDVALVLVAAR